MKLADLFKQSSIYFVGDIVRRGLGFVMIPVYTRFLTPADYGIIELIELFVVVAGICFGLGAVAEGMVRIYHDGPDAKSRASVISTALIVVAIAGIVAVLIASAIAGPLSARTFGTQQYDWLIRAAFVAMLFGSLVEIGLVYQRIQLRSVFFVTFSLVQLGGTAALNVYFIAFAHMGVWGFVLAKLIVTGIGAVVLLSMILRETGWRFRWEPARQMLRFTGPLMFSGGAFFVMHFSDRFFLNHYADLSMVGMYALAYKFGFLVTYLVGQPFGSVWNVSLYGYVGEDRWREQFARVIRYLIFFLMLAAVGLSIFSDEALRLMAPPSYFAAAALVPLIAFGYVFREIGDFFRTLLFINKQVLVFGRITISCAILNLALDWILIARFKAAGAAWATLLTWAAYMIGCWVLAQREHKVPYPLRSFALMLVLAVAVCMTATLLRGLPLLWHWSGCGLAIVIYLWLTWRLGYFDSHERAQIVRQLVGGRDSLLAFAGRSR